MLIAKNDEAERSKLWRIVITVSSVVIVLIAVFFLYRMFTSNPLEGAWTSEDSGLTLDIRDGGEMTVTLPEVAEEQNVQVKLQYSLDRKDKTVGIAEIAGVLDELSVTGSGNKVTIQFNTAIEAADAVAAGFTVTGSSLDNTFGTDGVQLSADGKTVTLGLVNAYTNVTSIVIGPTGNEIANDVNGTEDTLTETWNCSAGVFTQAP